MNICMFTNTYLPHVGGVARSVQFFAEDLITRGHRVLVVAPTFSEHAEPTLNRPKVVRVPAIQHFNGSDFSVRIPLPLYIDQEIEEFVPDIVHSHHPFLLGDAAVRVARKRDLPLVFTHHTLYERYNELRAAGFGSADRFRETALDHVRQPLLPGGGAEPQHRRPDPPARRPPADCGNPTGVDVSFFAAADGQKLRREINLPEDALVIGHLGRLAPEKNLLPGRSHGPVHGKHTG